VTVCCAKKSGVQRCAVISQAVALAPFSQNSKGKGWAGLTQAQLPGIIDATASIEGTIERMAGRTREAPVSALAAAFCAGALLVLLSPRRG
jgi:hypothetical protein